ncbi:ATP-binding protein [Streptomyces laculatispora]|uniref:ATP-binding protein n=1 Tax=Streptomyces laculatispora TaxID=887464 RepID=A0ABY9I3P5_9ACTN|nr:ATP-binding protein [Streptomyces laculatispora]WLQ41239.1 ATP-binding protein [Streptomyces laculatispora]
MAFTGRSRELRILGTWLERVTSGAGGSTGQALVIKGRRRIGKTRLVQEFCARSGQPYVFFQATRSQPAPMARRALFDAVACGQGMRDHGAALEHAAAPQDWVRTLAAVAATLPADEPVILVLDEVPWLSEANPGFDAALKTAWDMHLSAKPVLLLLLGSDLAMMDRLTSYDQPFYGRAGQYTVGPLSPADVQDSTGLDAAAALDAYLVTGGFPEVVTGWRTGEPVAAYLNRQVEDPSSVLLTTGERSLAAEFPARLQAGRVLRAIGAGERTFSGIAASTGGADGRALAHGTLAPILAELTEAKRIVAADLPLSTRAAPKLKRYRIADTYLRFWLAHLENAVAQAERGRGEISAARIQQSWPSWRGRAVEPVIRESLARRVPDGLFPEATEVGGWWNRQNNPEVDLIGADTQPVARQVAFVGSVKWRDETPFGARDLAELVASAQQVPGAQGAALIAVGRRPPTDAAAEGLAAHWGPEAVIAAWR